MRRAQFDNQLDINPFYWNIWNTFIYSACFIYRGLTMACAKCLQANLWKKDVGVFQIYISICFGGHSNSGYNSGHLLFDSSKQLLNVWREDDYMRDSTKRNNAFGLS